MSKLENVILCQSDDRCCNTCDEVREAYRNKGWAITNMDLIDQVTSIQTIPLESPVLTLKRHLFRAEAKLINVQRFFFGHASCKLYVNFIL